MPKNLDLTEELAKLYAELDAEEALLIARGVINDALFEIRTGRRKHSNMSEAIICALDVSPKKRKGRKPARPDFNYLTGEVIHTADRLRSQHVPESEEI
jgi:hypothetical protein